MAIARRVGGPQGIEVEGHHADSMCSIQQYGDAHAFECWHKFFEWHSQSSGTRDRVNHRQHRSITYTRHNGVNGDLWSINWEWNVHGYNANAPTICDKINRIPARLVGMVWNKDFITSVELQRSKHRVDARCCVFDKCEVISLAR